MEEVLPRSQGGCHPSPLAAREDEDGVNKTSIILNVSVCLVTIIIAGHQLCESINTSALLICDTTTSTPADCTTTATGHNSSRSKKKPTGGTRTRSPQSPHSSISNKYPNRVELINQVES